MRFDRLRHHRQLNPAPSPQPPPIRWFDRHRLSPSPGSPDSPHNLNSPSSPSPNAHTPKPHSAPPPPPAPVSRADYVRALEARMDEMDRVPTNSFYNSYAGEFDVLSCEERRATRKLTDFETSTRVENACRNRYNNILSNEPTRVRLQSLSPGDNDYINANHVTGPSGHPGYIATQAPLQDTTPHFWQMVYEAKSPIIVMLTRQHEEHCNVLKCDTYWPPARQTVLFNDYMVQALDERVDSSRGLVERRFHVGRVVDKRRKHARDLVHADSLVPPSADDTDVVVGGDGGGGSTPARTRSNGGLGDDVMDFDSDTEDLISNLELIGQVVQVTQLQFMEWPDQDVPADATTLLGMLRHADRLMRNAAKRGRVGPPIVHCSAGVGRTGTFIAIDWTLRRLQYAFARDSASSVGVDEIRELVRQLKRERSKMVQTADQYKFIYQAVLEGMKRWEMGTGKPFDDGVNRLLMEEDDAPVANESDLDGGDSSRLRSMQMAATG